MKKKSLYWQIPLLLLLVVGTIYIARQGNEQKELQETMTFRQNEGITFDTGYKITYESDSDYHGELIHEMTLVDREFSMFNEKSTVAAINRGETPHISDIYKEVYELSMRVNADTDGAFDITVAPLVNAWGFGFRNEQLPTEQQVDSLLKIRNQYDFSAIAKGYACDLVAAKLDSLGVKNYLVEIGGEVVTRGHNPKGSQWRIGVTKPAEDQKNEIYTIVDVENKSLATSGNYRNFYYKKGRKYAHTIDPRTGYPVQHELLSATVITDRCVMADAYATAFMVLGLEKSKQLLMRHPEMKAYLIYTDEQGELAVWHSDGLIIEDV
ncbi:MAG: FAD:protein FMN transferase [Prevotella sp.]|nr:FAD:protein FMN transferase [Prevotella sp.]